MKDPYDILLAIRLSADYRPTAAWQMPRATVELTYPHATRTSLTAKLLADPNVVQITEEQLVEAARRVAAGRAPSRRLWA
jgi:hypothetical protein